MKLTTVHFFDVNLIAESINRLEIVRCEREPYRDWVGARPPKRAGGGSMSRSIFFDAAGVGVSVREHGSVQCHLVPQIIRGFDQGSGLLRLQTGTTQV